MVPLIKIHHKNKNSKSVVSGTKGQSFFLSVKIFVSLLNFTV